VIPRRNIRRAGRHTVAPGGGEIEIVRIVGFEDGRGARDGQAKTTHPGAEPGRSGNMCHPVNVHDKKLSPPSAGLKKKPEPLPAKHPLCFFENACSQYFAAEMDWTYRKS
jgi:hypothetical protein